MESVPGYLKILRVQFPGESLVSWGTSPLENKIPIESNPRTCRMLVRKTTVRQIHLVRIGRFGGSARADSNSEGEELRPPRRGGSPDFSTRGRLLRLYKLFTTTVGAVLAKSTSKDFFTNKATFQDLKSQGPFSPIKPPTNIETQGWDMLHEFPAARSAHPGGPFRLPTLRQRCGVDAVCVGASGLEHAAL